MAIYHSGGFTTYDDHQLCQQLQGLADREGCRSVKIKIGSHPDDDPQRARVAKAAIGETELFVDANQAFTASQALGFARTCDPLDIPWFEEPTSSDDAAGLRRVRGGVPGAMEVAAGEYIWTLDGARRLLEAGAVDALQADVTRCGGVTGFLQIAALCEAHHTDLSGHCARRFTATWRAPRRGYGIWSGSTTMSGSNDGCSTARRRPGTERSPRTSPLWAMGLPSDRATQIPIRRPTATALEAVDAADRLRPPGERSSFVSSLVLLRRSDR